MDNSFPSTEGEANRSVLGHNFDYSGNRRSFYNNKFLITASPGSFLISVRHPGKISIIMSRLVIFLTAIIAAIVGNLFYDNNIPFGMVVAVSLAVSCIFLFFGRTNYIIERGSLCLKESPVAIKTLDLPIVDISGIDYKSHESRGRTFYTIFAKLKNGSSKSFGASLRNEEHIIFLKKALEEHLKADKI